ncbi:hypothetical protein OG900_19235 [Streptomyces sp. NBC_00433]
MDSSMRGRLAALTAATAAVVGLGGGLAGQAYAAPISPAVAYYCALGQHQNHPMIGQESINGGWASGLLAPGPTCVADPAATADDPALDAPSQGAAAATEPQETAPTAADPGFDLRA